MSLLEQTPTNKPHPKSPTRAPRGHTSPKGPQRARARAHTRAGAKSKKKFRYRDSNPSLLGVSARAGAAVKAKYDNPIVRR